MQTCAQSLLSALIIAFALAPNLRAHTIDIIELPNEGGISIFTDGSLLNLFPGAESAIVGANFNDGDYSPQVINVDLYDDPGHTIVSDRIDITVPGQNPGQITVGLTSDTQGVPLAPLSPENLALTETGALQNIVTLTNARRIQTTIRIESDLDAPSAAAPEPASFSFGALGCVGLAIVAARLRRRPTAD